MNPTLHDQRYFLPSLTFSNSSLSLWKITFGRPPEPGEPLRWVTHVNPFRRAEHAALLAHGLALAGLSADPDERSAPRPVPAPGPRFRRDGDR